MNIIFPAQSLGEQIICFTTTRAGGYSEAPYDSWNLAAHVGDEPSRVRLNRQHLDKCVQELLPSASRENIHALRFLKQTHSNKITVYDPLKAPTDECDAIVAKHRFQPLTVLTADCLPIALVSQDSDEIAMVHAGWRGLLNGVIENTLNNMQTSPAQLKAWIGPSICQAHFEVGNDLAAQFAEFQLHISKAASDEKSHLNLSGIAKSILLRAGLTEVQESSHCSYCDESLFSFRRASHLKQGECGRMATVLLKH